MQGFAFDFAFDFPRRRRFSIEVSPNLGINQR